MATISRPGFERSLSRELSGEILFDAFSRGRYATDASIYQMMPVGVAVPQSVEDIEAAISISRAHGVPVLPRGGGTSQCGQTVNQALVIDNSKHFNKILELDVENRRCVVQPGIVLDELNRALKPHGLWFPVDVSTASRATIGGMTANNSCGGRSLRYGIMRDNVLSIEAVMADGAKMHFGPFGSAQNLNGSNGVAGSEAEYRALVEDMLALGMREAEEIAAQFPNVMRRVGGYNIDALVPDAAFQMNGASNNGALLNGSNIAPNNMAHLLVGSEGTLAYFTAIELKLSPLLTKKVTGVCHFAKFYEAMDATQHIVKLKPQGVELVDATMIGLARDIPLFAKTMEQFVRGNPEALLLVEFAETEDEANLEKLAELEATLAGLGINWEAEGRHWGGVVKVTDNKLQGDITEVRKAGLNIMMSMKEAGKPVSFVEDCAVELPDLAEYTAGITEIFSKHGTKGTWYAHASVGCLHVRPVLNMKLDQDVQTMRSIAEEAFELVRAYKGSHSGEHGDGIVRSEFHEQMFGSRMVSNFKEVKQRFDPAGLFNPGKIVDPPKMDDRSNFRYHHDYENEEFDTELDWTAWPGTGGGMQGAVEMCNNNGACRKLKGGTMCPSYRVTKNERDVTRGRANSLRLAISGQLGSDALSSDLMMETLKLCVSCKGCKRECPTGVDMAAMKIEVLAARAKEKGISLHDRLVAYLPRYAHYAAKMPGLMNLRNKIPMMAKLLERPTGMTARRDLPEWRSDHFKNEEIPLRGEAKAVLFADCFNRYFEPENLRATGRVMAAAGLDLAVAGAPDVERPLCCGRTFLSAGLVDEARVEARRLLDALMPFVDQGLPVIGLEPSCLLTLRDEIPRILPGGEAEAVAAQALMLEEYIAEHAVGDLFKLPMKSPASEILLHGHCHQKAFGVMGAIEKTLSLIPGANVETVETSCCGMAGSFGYGVETYDTSVQMAELDLLPAVRKSGHDTIVVADGTSCRHQIADGTARQAIHVARVLDLALKEGARS